jgi:chromosome partitioning protein
MQQKIITVTNFKGGTGKSTTAIHLAAYFQAKGKTILIDGDPNRSALTMAARGAGFPFEIGPEKQLGKLIQGRDYVIIDTAARPGSNDLAELSAGCDLMILPVTPSMMAADPTLELVKHLKQMKANYRALITIIPPPPSRDGELMREELWLAGVPVFDSMIRRRSVYERAVIRGRPLSTFTDTKATIAWEEFQTLGREVEQAL